MKNLFGLPTPSEVRQQARGRLFESINSQQFSGLNAGMNRAGANIGAAIGSSLAGASPQEQRAAKIQGINKTFTDSWISKNGKPETPEQISEYGTGLMSEYMQAGELGMAMMIRKQLPEVDTAAKDLDFKQLNVHRKRVETFSKDMKSIDAAYEKIGRNAKEGTATGDMGMTFGIMKLYDPNSTVREGEYATAKNAAGVPTRILNLYNSSIDGQFLLPEQRKAFLATAKNLYEGQRASTDRSIKGVLEQAEQDELSGERVLGTKRFKAFKSRQPKVVTTKAQFDALKSGDIYIDDGVEYKKP